MVDHGEVVDAATLKRDDLCRHLRLAEMDTPIAEPIVLDRVEEANLRFGTRDGKPVATKRLDDRLAVLQIELGDEIALAEVEVYGARMHGEGSTVLLDVAQHSTRLAVDDRDGLIARAA